MSVSRHLGQLGWATGPPIARKIRIPEAGVVPTESCFSTNCLVVDPNHSFNYGYVFATRPDTADQTDFLVQITAV